MLSIYASNKLTETKLKQVHELEQLCRSFDNTKGSISLAQELNFYKEMNCFYMAYDGEILVGVVSVFAPIKDEAEISALILPRCRRKGLFTKLLSEALAELKRFGIAELYFVHDTGSTAGKAMIERWGIDPDHSEYLLIYDEHYGGGHCLTDLKIKQAVQEDLYDMTKLSLGVFGGNEEEWIRLHQKSLDSSNIQYYISYCQGEQVGIGSVNITEQGLFIFGFGILPTHRRKGLGRAFLCSMVEELQSKFNDGILLEVDSENHSAFMLYTTNGFKKKVQFDYYKRIITDIKPVIC